MRNWTNEKIAKWHCETFPKTNLGAQCAKLEEEIQEFQQDQSVEEAADIAIVAIALKDRFCCEGIFTFVMNTLFQLYLEKDIDIVIDEKMEINAKRVWEKKNGTYHHKE